MTDFLLVTSILLGFAFILALIVPGRFLPGSNPKRSGAFLLYLIPSFVCFIAVGVLYQDPVDVYLEDLTATYIDLPHEGLSALPEGYSQFESLKELNLRGNKFTEVPPAILQLPNLKILDLTDNQIAQLPEGMASLTSLRDLRLAGNPLTDLPNWLGELPNLAELTVSGVPEDMPASLQRRMADSSLAVFFEAPKATEIADAEYLAESEVPDEEEAQTSGESDLKEEDHTESFGEFAIRNLLGRDDLGHKRTFGDNELFYDSPVPKSLADSVGDFLVDLGLFAEDRSVSVQLLANKDLSHLDVKMVSVWDDPDEVEEDIMSVCGLYATLLSGQLAGEPQVSWHMCNDNLEILASAHSEDFLEE